MLSRLKLCNDTMSRKPLNFNDEDEFVSADALLARALEKEAINAEHATPIGAGFEDLHKCTYTVAADGTVSCKSCGKGTVKKVSHNGKKRGKHTKTY